MLIKLNSLLLFVFRLVTRQSGRKTVDFWQKFVKPIPRLSDDAVPPVGVPGRTRRDAPVPACEAPVLARSNPRNTGGSRLTAEYNRLSTAFD